MYTDDTTLIYLSVTVQQNISGCLLKNEDGIAAQRKCALQKQEYPGRYPPGIGGKTGTGQESKVGEGHKQNKSEHTGIHSVEKAPVLRQRVFPC